MGTTDSDTLLTMLENIDEVIENIPNKLPMMSVRDVVIFNDMLLPLFVGRKESLKAVETANKDANKLIFLSSQKDPNKETTTTEDIYKTGIVARILKVIKIPDGKIKILVQGLLRAEIVEYIKTSPFYVVNIKTIKDKKVKKIDLKTEALMRAVKEDTHRVLSYKGNVPEELLTILNGISDPGKLADLVASNIRLKINEAQSVLETIDPIKRLERVHVFLKKELQLSSVQAKIQSNVLNRISKSQKDYFLREQVRAINKELGNVDEGDKELEEYEDRIKKAKMTEQAEDEAFSQLKRLSQMYPESQEAGLIRTYLDWLLDMPWNKKSKEMTDIDKAQKALDRSHYGLKKIKDRILEYLSVKKLNPNSKGSIICFVGPPGVGKTSLGKAIAKATNRKFIRISLGGIRDEAEIRGHRRTYIGALPGRILQGLKQAGTKNPVFMMDEIDKLGSDYRGDPSSALLEALDPEQNSEFSDHYLNVAFDLSKVMFILTANLLDTIPPPLLDRMEIIKLSGYTQEEKEIIARKYLVPRQIKEMGLTKKFISLKKDILSHMISSYTSEAGVRELDKTIASVCRKVARKVAEGKKEKTTITKKNIHEYLGPEKYMQEMENEKSEVGISTGLAWTQVGGEALYIETSIIKGKGEIIITGQLGDVMQESAKAAISYAKKILDKLKIKENFFTNKDVHIHVPAGATPKDGPSAGIGIATSIISAILNAPIDKKVAMTGEITLSGRVLPIGGLKEKAIGALRAKIETVIIPQKNEKDLYEVDKKVKDKIKFITVSHMDEVLKVAIKDKRIKDMK